MPPVERPDLPARLREGWSQPNRRGSLVQLAAYTERVEARLYSGLMCASIGDRANEMTLLVD